MFFHTTGILYRNVFNGIPPRHYINKWSCDIFIVISHAEHGKIFHMDEDMAVYRAHPAGRFSTMAVLDGWKFNIGGLQRYNAWLGFRFMKPFAKSISKYCHVILTESGKNGIGPLSFLEKIKYTIIKYIYTSICSVLDIPNRVSRTRLRILFRIIGRIERHRLQAMDTAGSHGAIRTDRAARFWNRSVSSPELSRMPLKSRVMVVVLSKISAALRVKMSDVRLPAIEAFGPERVMPGERFNTQPDGQSAMWLRVEGPLPAQTKLVFDGTALLTLVSGRLVTAAVPAWLTARPARMAIWLESDNVDGLRVCDPVCFEVAAPAKGKNGH